MITTKARPAVADKEGSGMPVSGTSDSIAARDVDEGLEQEQQGQAGGHQAGEGVGGGAGDFEAAVDQKAKQADDDQRADQAELLANDRKNRVVGRLRQVAVNLDALAQPNAKQAAGADADQRLGDVVAAAAGVAAGVQELGEGG